MCIKYRELQTHGQCVSGFLAVISTAYPEEKKEVNDKYKVIGIEEILYDEISPMLVRILIFLILGRRKKGK